MSAVCVLVDGDNVSDHFAITTQFAIPALGNNPNISRRAMKHLWDKGDISYYQSVLQALLSRVYVLKHALVCSDKNCKDKAHTDDLDLLQVYSKSVHSQPPVYPIC